MALRFETFTVSPFMENCSLIWCDASLEAAFVDPGGDAARLQAAAARAGVRPTRILITHGHVDHVGACAELATHYGIPIEGPHPADAFWLDALEAQSRMFGFPHVPPFQPDRWLEEGQVVTVGNESLDVLHTPGHTPGHVAFFSRSANTAFVGDVLFAGSVGRTDFPQGNHRQLLDSIRTRLWPLGNDVAFVPGHGPMSTFGEERANNPFVADVT